MKAEIAESTPVASAGMTAGLAALDPVTAKLVQQMQVTKERMRITRRLHRRRVQAAVHEDRPAVPRHGVGGVVPGVPFALGDIAPNIVFGQVTDAVEASSGNDASTAYAWALVVVFIAIAVGFAAKYSRIYAQRFNQSVIVVLRRRVFFRLSRLGVNYYDRELPGDVATRVVADLDRILTFVQDPAFRFASQAMIFFAAMAAIIVLAPAVLPVVLALIGIILVITLVQPPLREPGAVVVA